MPDYFHNLVKNNIHNNHIDKKTIFCINPLCKESNPWAEPNLPKDYFMCYSCRDSAKWAFNLLQENIPLISSTEECYKYIKSLFIKG